MTGDDDTSPIRVPVTGKEVPVVTAQTTGRPPARLGRASDVLSPEEFERWQLGGRQVFCRRCGLLRNQAIAMRPCGKVSVRETDVGHIAFTGQYVGYRCPQCGHHAMSEVQAEP